ncbi:MAG: M55 family metallopeptidase [Defluviitaleaceae bacterium]|nr:M55 family metallopeptidase [Defluviitaleaceae bacterium]
MKVFISADIEGITTTTAWEETDPNHQSYPLHAKQMTEEVLAAIAGAKAAGAKEIIVKDAHGPGKNIDPTRMPSGVTLIRGWKGHPYSMVSGIDKSFDAAMFVGYHSPSGRMGNPMSHTLTGTHVYLKINTELASEFTLYSYAAALEGVPTVFLSGDKMLCDDYKDLHPKLITCAVKDGLGNMTMNYSTEDTLKSIQELSKKALKQNLKDALIKLPKSFEAELYFKDHHRAERASHFPGVTKKSDNIVTYSSENFFEILRATSWIIH